MPATAPAARPPSDQGGYLELLLRNPDPYPFLTAIQDYLAVHPDDDAMRARAVGLLVGKGLYSVAAETARACPPGSPHAAELARVADGLASLPQDLIAPASTDERFAANLAALRGRGGHHAELADAIAHAWDDGGAAITLHRASDGNLLARAARSDGRRIWVPAALDFAHTVEVLAGHEAWQGNVLAPFLVEGVGGGWLVPQLHAATDRIYLTHSPAIFIVEPNLRAWGVVLRLHDFSAVLADERVYAFGGSAAWAQWQALMARDRRLAPPRGITALVPWPGSPPSLAEHALEQVVGQRRAQEESAGEAVARLYEDRDRAFWARRYASAGPQDPLRILAVTSRFTTFLQHSTRDLLTAFERLGCHTRLLVEAHDHALLSRRDTLEAFAEFQPDLAVVIDHHRQEMPDRFPRNVPFACWIQDELPALFEPAVGPRLHEFDFVIGYGRTRCVLCGGYPAERFLPCRVPVDVAKFAPAPGEGIDGSLRCDVAFVSHHSEPPEALHARLRSGVDHAGLRALMDAFFEATRARMAGAAFNAGYDLDAMLRRVEADAGLCCPPGPLRDRLLATCVRPLADRTIRHATLAWVADWADATGRTLNLYGRGWEYHPRFGRYARGEAGHGRPLAAIARASAINLHAGLSSALHQRVLETAAAGGFVMVRYNPLDFHPPGYAALERFLVERGVREPVRISHADLPPEFVAGRRRRLAAMGRPVPDHLDVTREYLLEQDPRRPDDRRVRFADLAFADFERITFDGPASFAQRADHFLGRPEERAAIAARMGQAVRELFTCDALAEGILAFVRRGLEA